MSSRRRRREQRHLVEPDPPVEITDPALAELVTHLNSRGHPEWGYRVKDVLRKVQGSEDLRKVQSEVVTELVGVLTEQGFKLPVHLVGTTETHEDPGSSEDSSESSEVKEDTTGTEEAASEPEPEPELVALLPTAPDDAGRDELVAYAAEHLDLDLPGNISKADAMAEINDEIERRTLALEGEGE